MVVIRGLSLGVIIRKKIVKWGNSLGLRIPKSFAKEVGISEGSIVDLSLDEGRLVICVASQPEYSLEDLLDGVIAENLHTEIDSGGPVGAEQW